MTGVASPLVVREFQHTLTRFACSFAHSDRVTRVAFAGQHIVACSTETHRLQDRRDHRIRFWDMTTGMEEEEEEKEKDAMPDSMFVSSNSYRPADYQRYLKDHVGYWEQQVGRFLVMTKGDLLTIVPAAEGGAGKAKRVPVCFRVSHRAPSPIAFFRAPSPISALDCTGADIKLGCLSGAVLQLQAEVLLT